MFTEMVAELGRGDLPDTCRLRRRFDMAATKKMGVLKLPPGFWTGDPKINPRSDHLFWAALLLGDRASVDTALSILAAETAEKAGSSNVQENLQTLALELVHRLLDLLADSPERRRLQTELSKLVPELFPAGDRRYG